MCVSALLRERLYIRRCPSICVDLRRGARSSVSGKEEQAGVAREGRSAFESASHCSLFSRFQPATLRKKRLSESESSLDASSDDACRLLKRSSLNSLRLVLPAPP